MRCHSGIVNYDPTELVITARAGTPLVAIEAALESAGQMLPCEPPHYGEEATTLDVRCHRGIVNYDPTELVITARAGTPLVAIEAALESAGQMLPCEPPHYGEEATWGGMVACGLAGPRRPWSGSVRDFVLGTRIITGTGKHLRFGAFWWRSDEKRCRIRSLTVNGRKLRLSWRAH